MENGQIIHTLRVAEGVYAELRELPAEMVSDLIKLCSSSKTPGWDIVSRGLALSLKKYGEQTFEPQDLQGPDLERKIGNSKHYMKIRSAWEFLHMPEEDDLADVKKMTVNVRA
jgi:hypothetical protein